MALCRYKFSSSVTSIWLRSACGTVRVLVWCGCARGQRSVVGVSRPPILVDYGTYARIVDFDQLPNGLLGITIAGGERFDVIEVWREPSGLVKANVEMAPPLVQQAMREEWRSLEIVLRGLENHPHVQRMNLAVDYDNAWEVAYHLVQLLPFEESIKYELLGVEDIDSLVTELDVLLNQISGEH